MVGQRRASPVLSGSLRFSPVLSGLLSGWISGLVAPGMAEVDECGVKSKSCRHAPAKGMFAKRAGPTWQEKCPVCSAYMCKDAAGLVNKDREKELRSNSTAVHRCTVVTQN